MNNLLLLVQDPNNNLRLDYIRQCRYDYKNAYDSVFFWEIVVQGKGTFANKEAIKKAGFIWVARRKLWCKCPTEDEIPKTEFKVKKEEMIEHYHSMGLNFPYCNPKCFTKGCNESVASYGEGSICHDCKRKETCFEGAKCGGWMCVPCKYDGVLGQDQNICKGCDEDAVKWAKEGEKHFGKGGWFGNDNS